LKTLGRVGWLLFVLNVLAATAAAQVPRREAESETFSSRGQDSESLPAADDTSRLTIVGSATLANGSIKGGVFDRQLVLLGIRYRRALIRRRAAQLSYAAEVDPGAWLAQPILGTGHVAVIRSAPLFTHTETTYAFGAAPLGIDADFRPAKTVRPVAGVTAGFLRFNRNVPLQSAAEFNFTFAVRMGVRLRVERTRELSIEYVYHHFSNWYRAPENPGVDCQMIAVGYGFGFRSRARLNHRVGLPLRVHDGG
jgi:hypothetical protein